MGVCDKISQDILRDCNNKPVQGVVQKLLLINVEDLPASGITFDATNPSSLITDINLNSGTNGYLIEGIKQIINYTNSFEGSADGESGVRHSISGIRINDPSAAIREEINKFIGGKKVYAILERNWKGANNASAFLFFGVKLGLELTDMTDSSNENDGTTVITLSTPEGFKEPYLPHNVLETDYSTTKTAFDNKFAAA